MAWTRRETWRRADEPGRTRSTARWLGDEASSWHARPTSSTSIEAEDTACVAVRFVNGGLGMIQVTTCADENHPALIQIQGTDGTAVVAGQAIHYNGGTPVQVSSPVARTDAVQRDRSRVCRRRAPPIEGHDARQTLADTLAMYESAARGVEVTCARDNVTQREHRAEAARRAVSRRFLDGRRGDRSGCARCGRGSLFRYYGLETPNEVADYEAEWATHIGVRHALAVNSGTSALFCALVAAVSSTATR